MPKFRPWVTAYLILGDKVESLLPRFKGLEARLARAKLKISFHAYVSLMILSTLLALAISLAYSLWLFAFWLRMGVATSLLSALLFSALASAIVFAFFCIYPSLAAGALRANIEANLPFVASYASIFASAGIPPERTFRSMASVKELKGVSEEAEAITKDVTLLGEDVLTAMQRASRTSSSPLFSELLEGYIGTVKSGGDVTSYLIDRARHYMSLRRLVIRKFVDSLSLVSEIYVSVLVATPLVLIILFVTMGMLGGPIFLSPRELLALLTYLLIPVLGLVFLLWVHMMSPKL